ncbi:MAG: FAD-binding protein [Clostridia bacterium]|nr:FAD-binding protein [Clostridia bacterium]
MKIAVCVKIIKGDINPFDASALECALRLSDDVTVISMCPPSGKDALLALTRLGAKVILLTDSVYAGSDTLATSHILSSALSKIDYDLIICGRQTVDGDTAQVGPCLSAMLDIPVITNVMEITEVSDKVKCKTRMGEEEVSLPCLITVERIAELRFPSIRSKVGEVTVWDNSAVGADVNKCGLSGSPTKVLKVFQSEDKMRHCRFIQKEELIPLIKKLSAESAEKEEIKESEIKLPKIYAVGKEVLPVAKKLSDNVVEIEKKDAGEIAEYLKAENAEVVLWNADLWGRRTAPIVSAMLETGLCADCTNLETDGEKLYMYRPAMSGDVYAKIECRTLPQMATVRCETKSADIVISVGKGAKNSLDKVKIFAESLGAEMAASRGLVDTGKAPYEHQVGLTGKKVSPKVYVALGISGAAHHTVGYEGAKYVIAVNNDKDARIFDYADFGVVCDIEEFVGLN